MESVARIEELDKRGKTIRDMFAGVAPRYDLLNHLLSASLDRVWRRRAAKDLGLASGSTVLDLCCGTGDQALALQGQGLRVTGTDFCLPMLAMASRKYRRKGKTAPLGAAGDTLCLPFREQSFDGATVAFGLRNVSNLSTALIEIARILKPGGRVAFLEFATPARQPLRGLYLVYFKHLLPAIARWLSPRGSAYGYLRDSVLSFPQRAAFVAEMNAAGYTEAQWRDLSAGIVCLYTGNVPGDRS